MKIQCLSLAVLCHGLALLGGCGQKTTSVSTLSDHVQEDDARASYRIRSIQIASFDGTPLSTLLVEPKNRIFSGVRPAIIFANSWICDEYEYLAQARLFAEKGYLVMSYASRGFGRSGGEITVASSDDIRDVSSLIDWLATNTNVDESNIATAGISYGGGLALLALAHDPRIKTTVSMSSWADLEMALYGESTIREVWLNLLLGSGRLLGRLSPDVLTLAEKLRQREDENEVRAWSRQRSPLTYIDAINQRQAPVFVANSYQDNLFPPRQMREFYEKLSGRKLFYMDPGIHTSSQLPGAFGLPSVVWDEVHRWLDHWLMGRETGILNQPPISFQTPRGREFYEEFPSLRDGNNARDGKYAEFQLMPVNTVIPANSGRTGDGLIHFNGQRDSGANTGIPLISDTIGAHANLPVLQWMPAINKRHGIVYNTYTLSSDAQLRGSPRVQVWLAPHSKSQQLVVYLYETNRFGVGKLVTHGVLTEHEPRDQFGPVNIDLGVIAYDFTAGHHLTVAIDSWDPFYLPPKDQGSLALGHGPSGSASLELPIVN